MGRILALEYALAHQQHLKGLVISNMVSSIPDYNRYARDVLMPGMPPAVLAEIQAIEAARDYDNPRYMELLIPHHYEHHVLRLPHTLWPDPVLRAFAHINPRSTSRCRARANSAPAASCCIGDRTADLPRISVPTLTIGAGHDTMDPAQMEAMSRALPQGRYLHCPNGSHMAMYDDQGDLCPKGWSRSCAA